MRFTVTRSVVSTIVGRELLLDDIGLDGYTNPYVKSDFQIVYEDDGEAVFTITLYDNQGNEVVATEDIVISYETTDLGAIAGEDYVAVSGQVVIEAGSSSATVSVPIIDDNIIENPDPEFAALTLTGISGAYSGDDVVIPARTTSWYNPFLPADLSSEPLITLPPQYCSLVEQFSS